VPTEQRRAADLARVVPVLEIMLALARRPGQSALVRSVVLLAVVILVSCGDPATSNTADEQTSPAASSNGAVSQTAVAGPVMRYPRRSNDNMGMAALIRGGLQLEGMCLYIAATDVVGERYPVLWPGGTTWDEQNNSVLPPVGAPIPIGSRVEGGGGFLYVSDVERLAGPDAAARASSCVDNTYGEIAVFNNQDVAAALATS
jgi:hypothetical protein